MRWVYIESQRLGLREFGVYRLLFGALHQHRHTPTYSLTHSLTHSLTDSLTLCPRCAKTIICNCHPQLRALLFDGSYTGKQSHIIPYKPGSENETASPCVFQHLPRSLPSAQPSNCQNLSHLKPETDRFIRESQQRSSNNPCSAPN